MEPSVAKQLWHVVRVVYYMLRKGLSKRKLMMDLQLLLKRSKIAGKALGNLMTFHHHHHHHHDGVDNGAGVGTAPYSAFSCLSMDPNHSFYSPKEVEFSCANTPSYPSFPIAKRKHRHHHGGGRHDCFNYDAATIAKAFEILNEVSDAESSTLASPSPMPAWSVGRSPAVVRQLRITDSPFPIREEEGEGADGHVDRQAEEFIKKFYEQLRLQQLQSAAATPDCRHGRTPLLDRA